MKRERLSDLAKKLQPYHKSTNGSVTVIAGDSGSTGDHAHILSDIDGELLRTQAPWVADDISTAVANHAAIVDAHHAKQHSIIDSANHTVTGAQWQVIGLTATNTLGLLSSSSAPGTNERILRSTSAGGLTLQSLVVGSGSGVTPSASYNGIAVHAATNAGIQLLSANTSTGIITFGDTEYNDIGRIIYRHSSDRLDFETGASLRVSINSTGYTLDVTGTSRFTTSVATPLITTVSGDLTIDPVGSVVFPVAQVIKTPSFSSSFPIAGFQINENPAISGGSVLTIGKIAVNELTADIFVANETRVDRGNMYWAKGFAILYSNYTTPNSIGDTSSIVFENSPHIAGALFSDNDWVMFQQVDIDTGFTLATVWGQVAGYTPSSDRQTWTFTLRGGPTSTLIKKGRVAVNFGASGQSLIHLSTVDSTGSPYIRFRKWTGADPISSSNYSTFTQIGNIGNLFGTTNEYGLFAGDGTTINDKYLRLSDSPSFNNIPINMSAGGVTKVRLDATYGLDILMPSVELQPQAITWRQTLSSGSPITRLDSWATGDSTTLLIETKATVANPAGTIMLRAYNNAGTRPAGINLISPPTGSSSAGIYGDTVAVGTLSSTVFINAASVVYLNADIDMSNNDIVDIASVAIGLSSASGSLDVARGSLTGGTAVFRGTTHPSHFNYSSTEDTFIRGGKDGSVVYINDSHTGVISMMQGRVQIRPDDSAAAFWIRHDGTSTVISSKSGSMYYGYAGVSGLTHHFYPGGTVAIASIDNEGVKVSGILSVGNIQFRTNDSATNFWIREDGANSIISTKVGDMYYGYNGRSGLSHRFYAGGTTTEMARVDNEGIKVSGSLSVGSAFNLSNGIACGNSATNYSPTGLNWSTTGTTLLLNALDYSVIGFHDSGSRVDFIRVGGGVMTLGYDGGFGPARVDFGGIIGGTWQSLTMGSGWVAWDGGSSWHPGQCKKVGDIVIIRGLVRRSSGSGTLIATLPAGYRPSKNEAFDCLCYNGSSYETSCRVDIYPDGTINLITGNGNGFVSLAGIVICTS